MAEQHGPGDEDAARRYRRGRRVLIGDDPLGDDTPRGEDPGQEAPVDLGAVRADDAMLDALGGANPGGALVLTGYELDSLLLSWRRDVDSEPFGELVDTETAVTTVLAARNAATGRRRKRLVPLATAAAVLAIAFGGVGMAARDAKPGDALWGLTQVLYSDHAHSVEAAVAVETDLNNARSALNQGRIGDARSALANAQSSLPMVASEDGKSDLSKTHESLVQQLNTTSPGATPPAVTPSVTSTHSPGSTTTTHPTTTTTSPTTTTTTPPTTTTTPSASVQPSTTSDNSSPKGSAPDPGSGAPPAGGVNNTPTSH